MSNYQMVIISPFGHILGVLFMLTMLTGLMLRRSWQTSHPANVESHTFREQVGRKQHISSCSSQIILATETSYQLLSFSHSFLHVKAMNALWKILWFWEEKPSSPFRRPDQHWFPGAAEAAEAVRRPSLFFSSVLIVLVVRKTPSRRSRLKRNGWEVAIYPLVI